MIKPTNAVRYFLRNADNNAFVKFFGEAKKLLFVRYQKDATQFTEVKADAFIKSNGHMYNLQKILCTQ